MEIIILSSSSFKLCGMTNLNVEVVGLKYGNSLFSVFTNKMFSANKNSDLSNEFRKCM